LHFEFVGRTTVRRTSPSAIALIVFAAFLTTIHFSSASAQESDYFDGLQRQAQQLGQAGKYTEALALKRRLAIEIEKAETASAAKPGAKTLSALQGVAWYALLAHDFRTALAASNRAHALAPSNLHVETNRAHALLLLGRVHEARALYRAYKGKPMSLTSDQLWEDVIADDIEALAKAGVDQRALKDVNVELGGKSSAYGHELTELNQKIHELNQAGDYKEAEATAERYIALARQRYSEGHPKFATALSWLGNTFRNQGRYDEAEPLFKRALAIDEKALGPDHRDVGALLNSLAENYSAQGRYDEAERLLKRALAIAEKAFGPDHRYVGALLHNLAEVYSVQHRNQEAEPLYKRALAIAQKALGPDHPGLRADLFALASLYRRDGHYAEAEVMMRGVLTIDEKALGRGAEVGSDLNNLALLVRYQGRYTEAELLYKRALDIDEKVLGSHHPNIGTELNNIAELYRLQGRYAEAEPLYKRALTIFEARDPENSNVSAALNNLGLLYSAQRRYVEAEPLYQRAIAIAERVFGPADPQVSIRLNNLALLYWYVDRYTEAEPLYRRALTIAEQSLGPDHPDVANRLDNLALLLWREGRYSEAEPLYKRALEINIRALGDDHPIVGDNLNNLATLYYDQNRDAEAEPLYVRALAIGENALGPDHPELSNRLNNLAALYFSREDWSRAAEYWRRSARIIIHRVERGTPALGKALVGKSEKESVQFGSQFLGLLKAAIRVPSRQEVSQEELFQIAQWAQSSEAAESLAQMAARAAAGDANLVPRVRERQDLVSDWQRRDVLRSASLALAPIERDRQANAEKENVSRLAEIEAEIQRIDFELAAGFPNYVALASPAALSVEGVKSLLAANEALVLFIDTPSSIVTPEETFIWVVTKTDARRVRSELGTSALTREVSALRCGLDYDGAAFLHDGRCSDLLKVSYTAFDHALGKPLPFDLARSYALYQALFGDVEDLIKDKRLLIVPSGPLTQLPFHVLVTKPPSTALPTSAAGYRDVAWLVREHAISVLPAVSSLKAVRELAKESHASERYIGFGNPLLDGDPDKIGDEKVRAQAIADAKLARDARCAPVQPLQTAALAVPGGGRITRGPDGLVEIAELRRREPLPETAEEVCGVASILGVDSRTHVYIGEDARETTVKRLSEEGQLAKYKVVHFATHGALAGQLSPSAEPGLILTPPDKASEIDDGYLSASEVAALKLDADWVILSACNTAAGEEKSAEALSGLARAFFYAGSRSLLVSHWYVASKTTVPLITTAIAMLTVDPKIGRAEALRRSMLSMIDTGKDYEAHPAFWAPFVLVGEGGAAR
jgi:tetratricopeptide (TPR) repeat protein/CHAT domain-containing protein